MKPSWHAQRDQIIRTDGVGYRIGSADLRELLVITLGRMKLDATAADSLGAARRLLDSDRFDLCLTDMNLGDGTGNFEDASGTATAVTDGKRWATKKG